jgi:hypothetical protein
MSDYTARWDFSDGKLIFDAGGEYAVTEEVARVTGRIPVAFRCVQKGEVPAGRAFTWADASGTWGPVMPFAGRVVAASLSVAGLEEGGTVTCQLGRNGWAAGSCYQLSVKGKGGRVSCIYDLAHPLTFQAGDEINFINVGRFIREPAVATCDVLVVFASRP